MNKPEQDFSHLNALQLGLSQERARLANATSDGERALRQAWVRQLEKEVDGERRFLDLPELPEAPEQSDEDLLVSLLS